MLFLCARYTQIIVIIVTDRRSTVDVFIDTDRMERPFCHVHERYQLQKKTTYISSMTPQVNKITPNTNPTNSPCVIV